MDRHSFLLAVAIVLGVAAATTILFRRLRQPVVLGYILAGFLIGPSVPFPLFADRQVVETLAELGVILLMFSLGLEFRLGKLFSLGPTAGLIALLQSSLMVWLGFVTGQAFGWTTLESLFAGAIIAISSTTIIAKAFDEQRIRGPMRELVIGVLIVEDLIAILLMATLTAIASGAGLSGTELAWTTGKLALFLTALVAFGLLVVPRSVRAIVRLDQPETILVASVGFCFAVSLLAHEFGYSVALGAFIAGSLVAESGEEKIVEQRVEPVRDLFAAIFFVSVGVLIDPALIVSHWPAIVTLTAVVIVGKIVGVSIGAFLTGNSIPVSVQAGMSLAQIGEFSFIIAGLGLSLGATGEFMYPVAVAVSAITTLTTPLLIRASGSAAHFVDRKMPRPLQVFVVLYGSWIERLRSSPAAPRARVRSLVRLLVFDVALLAGVAIAAAVGLGRIAYVEELLGVDRRVAQVAVLGLAALFALPLGAGVIRLARRLGFDLAERALPTPAAGALDLAVVPRRVLVATLQVAIVLLTGLPVLALTQPVLGGFYGAAVFALLLAGLGVAFWRGAEHLEGHVRAGAATIVEALIAQSRKGAAPRSARAPDPLERIHGILPGLGEPATVRVAETSSAAGRSLADLNLRAETGATVLAITRGEQGVVVPGATEVLQPGDLVALAGSHDAIDSARALLGPASS